MEKTEGEIEKEIGEFFLSVGLFCQKFPKIKTFGHRRTGSYLSLNGSPDLYIIYQGRFIGVEVKKPRGKQSPDQVAFMERVRRAGGLYFVAYSLGDAEAIYKAIRAL